jgi:hypothetical protein
MEFLLPEGEGPIPPQFAGFLMAILGMLVGSLTDRHRLKAQPA